MAIASEVGELYFRTDQFGGAARFCLADLRRSIGAGLALGKHPDFGVAPAPNLIDQNGGTPELHVVGMGADGQYLGRHTEQKPYQDITTINSTIKVPRLMVIPMTCRQLAEYCLISRTPPLVFSSANACSSATF